MLRKIVIINLQKGLGRPTKKDSRELSKFTNEVFSNFDFDDSFFDDEE